MPTSVKVYPIRSGCHPETRRDQSTLAQWCVKDRSSDSDFATASPWQYPACWAGAGQSMVGYQRATRSTVRPPVPGPGVSLPDGVRVATGTERGENKDGGIAGGLVGR